MNTKLSYKLAPTQAVLISESQTPYIYDIDPEEYDFIESRATKDEYGNLILSMPLLASIKKFLPEDILQKVDIYIQEMNVPEIVMHNDRKPDIQFGDLNICTDKQLVEYLSIYGGYKAYLEAQLAYVESKRGVLTSGFEEGLAKMMWSLERGYEKEGKKKPNKESLHGEAVATNPTLRKIRQDLIETEALWTRVLGMRNSYRAAYEAVSRVVALRTNAKEKE